VETDPRHFESPPAWRQLPLPFAHTPHYTASDFLPAASNAAALAWLDRTPDWPQGRLALWGAEGCGKTHLLHVWAGRSGAVLLSGPALPRTPSAPACPLAIDDADAAAELPLLHLLNAAAEAGRAVLLAGRTPPARWPTGLPDLASRLRAVVAVKIGPAEDDLLRALLARLLAERQIAVAAPVQDWLLARLPRTPAAVREAAARLDRAALAAGRAVTRAVAAAVLAGLAETDEDDGSAAAPAGPSSTLPRLL
jgi:chromosomal replication initiation ATPase DnaA